MTEREMARLLKDFLPSEEGIEAAGNRVLQRLRQSTSEEQVQGDEPLKALQSDRRNLVIAVAGAAIVLFLVSAAFLRNLHSDKTMERTNGNQAGVPLPDPANLSQTTPSQKLSFEIVSVKPNSFGVSNRNSSIGGAGGRFVAKNVTLRVLMKYAYRSRTRDLLDGQLMGGPTWMDTDRFDVEAKPEGDSRPIPLEEMQRMVQSLLQDRFQLKIHRQTREMPVYDLIVVNRGKLKLSEDQSPVILGTGPLPSSDSAPPPRGAARLIVGSAGGILAAKGIGMGKLADSLQTQVDRPIIDKTNLPGLYDISLRFAPESDPLVGAPLTATAPGVPATSDPTAPPLFSAIQDQLGLKLQPGTGIVEVIVIDTVQKPSEN
jgi:uncharacterized protein (TIGR03435 family)